MLLAMSTRQRSLGWTNGRFVDRLDVAGSSLFETVYTHPTLAPSHEHSYPYVAVLLKGRYREIYRHGEAYFTPFTAVFHPANVKHSCVLNERGCRFLYSGTRAFVDGFVTYRRSGEFRFRLAWRKNSLADASTSSRISRQRYAIYFDGRKFDPRDPC